jgi:secreted trypsin-like serine protease
MSLSCLGSNMAQFSTTTIVTTTLPIFKVTAFLTFATLASAGQMPKVYTQATLRVIGGSEAEKGAYPWVVALDALVEDDPTT